MSAPSDPASIAQILFDHVRTYARFGEHRTGGASSAATLDWVAGAVRGMGAAASRWSYDYRRYRYDAQVEIDGRPVDCLPLSYEGVGEVRSEAPYARAVTLANNYDKSDLVAALAEAEAAQAQLALFATIGGFGDRRVAALIGVNVDPDAPKSGIPTLLVPGAIADALKRGKIRASLRAELLPHRAENLLARVGAAGGAPILITTPLTGWFTCAAERGSGIAVALELARALSTDHAVALLATTGHELENLGLRRQLAAGLDFVPRAVIHIGASLAACAPGKSGRLELWPGRIAASNRPMSGAFGDALIGAGFIPSPRFFGEGQEWHRLLPQATPLLSFSGAFPAFHTPLDLPDATTTPAALARVYQAVAAATRALIQG